jgi:hypothetical protein
MKEEINIVSFYKNYDPNNVKYEIWFPETSYIGGMGGEIKEPRKSLGTVKATSPHRALFMWASTEATALQLNDLVYKDWIFTLNGSILEAIEC